MSVQYSYESSLINKGQLICIRNNAYISIHESPEYNSLPESKICIPATSLISSNLCYYWYRSMPKTAFDLLVNNDQISLLPGEGYCGISPSKTYVAKYMTNPSEYTHLIQFMSFIDLIQEQLIVYENTPKGEKKPLKGLKIENGAYSFGLADTGHRMLPLFNKALQHRQIIWQLIKWHKPIIKN